METPVKEIVRGNLKAAMKQSAIGSSEVWKVLRQQIRVRPGYNVRVDSQSYKDHIRFLADSIKANGFYDSQPLGVIIAREGEEDVIYVCEGHSRLAAFDLAMEEGAELSGTLPCISKPRGTTELDLIVALHTSNSGRPLTPYELGLLAKRMIDFGQTVEQIGYRLGKTKGYIENLLLLVSAPSEIIQMVVDDRVSATLAVETLKRHGDKAVEKLQDGASKAAESGKAKVTRKSMNKAAKRPDLVTLGCDYIKRSGPFAVRDYLVAMLAELTNTPAADLNELIGD